MATRQKESPEHNTLFKQFYQSNSLPYPCVLDIESSIVNCVGSVSFFFLLPFLAVFVPRELSCVLLYDEFLNAIKNN